MTLDGMFEVTKRSGERDLAISGCQTGEVIGEIALFETNARNASGPR